MIKVLLKIIIFDLFLLKWKQVGASHFRGGTVSWKVVEEVDPTPGQLMVQVNYGLGWRRSYFSKKCDDEYIVSQEPISSSGSWLDNPHGTNNIICTAYDTAQDWHYGYNSFNFSVKAGEERSETYNGCCWLSGLYENKGGNSWYLSLTMDLGIRSDSGKPNASPVTFMPPLVTWEINCTSTFVIPVTDPDGDVVSCRYAKTVFDCGAICDTTYPFVTLDESACTLSYNVDSTLPDGQLLAMSFMIADSPYKKIQVDNRIYDTGDELSAVGLQFLIQMQNLGSCSEKVRIDDRTMAQDACSSVATGGTFNTTLYANASLPNRTIDSFTVMGPVGVTKGQIVKVQNGTFSMSIAWTPKNKHSGKHSICFTATDNIGKTSEFRCFIVSTQGVPCDEVNECTLGIDGCSEHAKCTNTIGGYTCTCKDPYTGDGFTCSVDPCFEPGNCLGGTCVAQENGSYSCQCHEFYAGDRCQHAMQCIQPYGYCDA